MMRTVVVLSLLSGLACGLSGCPKEVNVRTYGRTVDVDGLARNYYVHPGLTYDGTRPAPLLIALHPMLCTPAVMEQMTGFSEMADRECFVAVYPEGINRAWNDGTLDVYRPDDVRFIERLIEDVAAEYWIDSRRIYVAGASNGAFMTHRLACELGNKFAAAAVVMGACMPEFVYQNCHPPTPVPMVMFQGTADTVVLFGGIGPVLPDTPLGIRSFFETMWLWVDRNGLRPSGFTITDLPDQDPHDGTSVTQIVFEEGNPACPVHAYVVHGGGHTWPGYGYNLPEPMVGTVCLDVNASEIIWDFFCRFPGGQ